MDNNIKVKILDSNGIELISSDDITKAIPKGEISIDEQKLFGIDNFIIDGRRAKLSFNGKVGLPSNMNIQYTNIDNAINTLKNIVTDSNMLIDDSVQTETHPCVVISEREILNSFAWDELFYRHFDALPQTWEDESENQTYLKIQSPRLLGLLTMPINTFLIDGGVVDPQFISFMIKLIQMNTTATDDEYTNINKIKEWLALRMPWLDDESDEFNDLSNALDEYLMVYAAVGDNHYGNLNYYVNPYNIESLTQAIFAMVGHGIDGFMSLYRAYSDVYIDTQLEMSDMETIYTGGTTSENFDKFTIAAFFASLIDYESYITMVNDLISNQFNPLRTTVPFINVTTGLFVNTVQIISTPFYRRRYITNYNATLANIDDEIICYPPNLFFNQLIFSSTRNITFAKKRQVNDTYIQFGKTQLKTDGNSTERTGIPIDIIDEDNASLHPSYFTPVERSYYIGNFPTKFKYIMDGWNDSILTNPQSFLVTGQFTNTNWMYFDKIRCEERILGANEETFVDNIPVYDQENEDETDNYGLYIYADYFDKYYTKSKSQLLNVVVEILINDNLIYRGLIDYNSVNIEAGKLSFDCLDSIGLMIDNLKKLENFIEFSQFDTIEFNNVAYTVAGTTLKEFVENIINTPFPYNSPLFNNDITVGEHTGLTNKILNEISAEDALIMANQCMKSLLYLNDAGLIDFDSFNVFSTATIDGQIISIKTSQEFENKTFSIDKIKSIANHQSFAPAIVAFFSAITKKYSIQKNIEIYNQVSPINLLDKISIDGNDYIVITKNYNLENKRLILNVIGGN